MRATYDPEADAAYFYFKEIQPSESVKQSIFDQEGEVTKRDIIADFDADDHILGIEVLNASKALHPDTLAAIQKQQ